MHACHGVEGPSPGGSQEEKKVKRQMITQRVEIKI